MVLIQLILKTQQLEVLLGSGGILMDELQES